MPEVQKTMKREEFLLEMDEILGLRAGTLRGDENLDELPNWDSVALVAMISLAESYVGIEIAPDRVVGCSTVADLVELAGVGGNCS